MSTQRVPLSQLLPPTANPRKRIDPAGIEGLARSIQTDGVLQNLVVKCLKGDRFRVVTGERRYRALKLLESRGEIDGGFRVPVEVRHGLSSADAQRIALVENVQREALDAIDEADGFATLLQKGATLDDMAAQTGLSTTTVKRRLALAGLCAEAKQAVRDGTIGLGIAEALTLGTHDQQRHLLADIHPTAQRAAQELWDKSLALAEERGNGEGEGKGRPSGGSAPPDKSLHYRKSVYVTASVLLAEFEDSVLEEQTAASDFSIADLVAGERPVTLYIVARPLDARRLRRVFKLILTQMVDFLTIYRDRADDGRARRWRLLVVLDEFLQFHLREAAEWIKYVREYGIRLLLLAQSLWEVEEEYGRGLTANCRLVVFRPNSSDEAERISRMVGEAIEEVPTRSTSKGLLDLFPTVSRGVRVDRRPVMPMHEALEMGGDDLIVFGYGKPIRATRLHPYADPRWRPLYGRAAAAWTPNPDANRWFGAAGPVPEGRVPMVPDTPVAPRRPGKPPKVWT